MTIGPPRPWPGYPTVPAFYMNWEAAPLGTNSVTGFFADVQSVYESVVPEWRAIDTHRSTDAQVRATEADITASGLFEPVITHTYAWTKDYTAGEYIRLLNTYSDHRALDEARRTRLYEGIKQLIETAYRGRVTRPYLTVLHVARKHAP